MVFINVSLARLSSPVTPAFVLHILSIPQVCHEISGFRALIHACSVACNILPLLLHFINVTLRLISDGFTSGLYYKKLSPKNTDLIPVSVKDNVLQQEQKSNHVWKALTSFWTDVFSLFPSLPPPDPLPGEGVRVSLLGIMEKGTNYTERLSCYT